MVTEFQHEQRERRETLLNDLRVREQGTAFAQFAQAEASEVGGRFKSVNQTIVVGDTPTPPYPAAAYHQHDPTPDEPPLNIDVNATEPVGTASEIQASIERLGETGRDPPGPMRDGGAVADPAFMIGCDASRTKAADIANRDAHD